MPVLCYNDMSYHFNYNYIDKSKRHSFIRCCEFQIPPLFIKIKVVLPDSAADLDDVL